MIVRGVPARVNLFGPEGICADGSGRLWRVSEGFGGFWRVSDWSGGLWTALEEPRRLAGPADRLHGQPFRGPAKVSLKRD